MEAAIKPTRTADKVPAPFGGDFLLLCRDILIFVGGRRYCQPESRGYNWCNHCNKEPVVTTEQKGINPELQAELHRLQNENLAQLPADTVAAMRKSTMELVQSGIADRALKPGEKAPDFSLPNAVGKEVQLHGLLNAGSVVATFYRGAW